MLFSAAGASGGGGVLMGTKAGKGKGTWINGGKKIGESRGLPASAPGIGQSARKDHL